jgi:hypothetical protein
MRGKRRLSHRGLTLILSFSRKREKGPGSGFLPGRRSSGFLPGGGAAR